MTPALKASARYWIVGTALAFSGVAVARWLAPGYADRTRAALALTGQLVALTGLAIILVGIRRRLIRASVQATES